MVLRLTGVLLVATAVAGAQQPIGTVSTADATVAGSLAVNNGQAVLDGSASVTAKDQTATVKLNRGGEVRVCATSSLHLTEGKSANEPAPLLLTLDRGAAEIQMPVTENDAIMTPDLRFAMKARGPLDLRLRVTSNGDTCVENRGANSPAVRVTDPFGGAMYILLSGQHVLFEHASLKEVVDNESSPCGCPTAPPVSVADASGKTDGSATAQHPFPEAISDGLAKPTVPQETPGVTHVQVSTTMSYDGTKPQAADSGAAGSDTNGAAQPQAKKGKGFGHSVGHFFKRIFGKL
ncbi:hypothetical protein GCM10011507_28960 [Edaphobacter acidisoli]|uniref:Uncharacterized protein n=1 Tax=Edaphobacter acidisoli TaxID=2040573 RepID=A0A916RXQ0_9BACT|nr:nuclease [Edaphobacter acidisoli]GGA75793.1 hypothetical protein GCM10011507_28960 [Edaphobacter acidisoli]